jgi:membrane protein YqaA with SNARE-associated domain
MEIFSHFAAEAALPTLFLLSFLAATLLPIGSEWLLALLILQGHSPVAVVMIAGCGNVLGASTTYLIGRYGSEMVTQRLLRIDTEKLQRTTRIYHRYGVWSLLLSWVPIIGDPLCLLAGIFNVGFARFSLPVIIGKFSRYGLVAAMLPSGGGGV